MPAHATLEAPAGDASATRRGRLAAHAAALLLGLGCIATCAQWGLRIWQLRRAPAPAAVATGDIAGLAAGAGGVFGVARSRSAAAAPRRFALQGVIGGGRLAGAALIGIDGKPPQAFAVGTEIAPGVRLVDTAFGSAVLSRNGVRQVLHTRTPAVRAGSGPSAATPAAAQQPASQPPTAPAPRAFKLEQQPDTQGGALAHRRFEGP